MNVFDKAISDIFALDDLCDSCIIDGVSYRCICSSVSDEVVYAGIGKLNDVNFTLSLKLPLSKKPKSGDKVKFRGMNYKITEIETDSVAASLTVHLESISK